MADATEMLKQIEQDIAAAQKRYSELAAIWRHQCGCGVFGAAEETEIVLDDLERKMNRYLVRRDALQEQLNQRKTHGRALQH
jgi:hypothetical protein